MKYFIFSRRFLIPLFVIWALHLAYTEWEMWNSWKDYFKNKAISSSLKSQWFLSHISPVLLLSFVISFLLAIVFYSHKEVKKNRSIPSNFFSIGNLFAVVLASLLAFFYSSFIEPKNEIKTQKLLEEIVWARSGNPGGEDSLKLTARSEDLRKRPRVMNIIELFYARDSLKQIDYKKEKTEFPYVIDDKTELRSVEYLINKKIAWSFIVMLFYFIGICLGASFYKVHVIIPLLISYFILLGSWFYIQKIFENLYHRQVLGLFFAVYGTILLFTLLTITWLFILRKYVLFTKKPDPGIDESIDIGII